MIRLFSKISELTGEDGSAFLKALSIGQRILEITKSEWRGKFPENGKKKTYEFAKREAFNRTFPEQNRMEREFSKI